MNDIELELTLDMYRVYFYNDNCYWALPFDDYRAKFGPEDDTDIRVGYLGNTNRYGLVLCDGHVGRVEINTYNKWISQYSAGKGQFDGSTKLKVDRQTYAREMYHSIWYNYKDDDKKARLEREEKERAKAEFERINAEAEEEQRKKEQSNPKNNTASGGGDRSMHTDTYRFTLDSKNVYMLKNGSIKREPKNEFFEKCDTKYNFGYLDESRQYALCITANAVKRIHIETFNMLKENGTVERSDIEGVLTITFETRTPEYKALYNDLNDKTINKYIYAGMMGSAINNNVSASTSAPVQQENSTSQPNQNVQKANQGIQGADPVTVASSAMNMSKEERERIGLTSENVRITGPSNTEGTHRRFTSSGEASTSNISTGSIHRPGMLPISKLVVKEETPAWYTATVLHGKFIPFRIPTGVKSRVCIDKRYPMAIVPMSVDDTYGYAYAMQVDNPIAPTMCMPIATNTEGLYWMFHNMYTKGDDIMFLNDRLSEVMQSHKSIFPELDISGKVAIVAKSIGSASAKFAMNVMTGDDTPSNNDMCADALNKCYGEFFEQHPKLFRIMKIDWTTGFVIALTKDNNQVLLMAAATEHEKPSDYPLYMTLIPIPDITNSFGCKLHLAVVGISPSEVSNIERELSGKADEGLPGDAIQ